MDKYSFSEIASLLEPVLCLTALLAIFFRGHVKRYSALSLLLSTRLLSSALLWPLLQPHAFGIDRVLRYKLYFDIYWTSYAIESALCLWIVYQIYNLAMVPLPGLQRLGRLVFRWAAGIAVIVAFGVAASKSTNTTNFSMRFVSQLQQTQSIVTLCLLLFVTLAVRPMGLSFRSKIFGVSFGLGMLATSDLVCSSMYFHVTSLKSFVSTLGAVGFLIAAFLWTGYFALPEPKRRMIVLPTTSPFLRWNQISLALGDDPGFVAVGGFDPEILAPAEVEIMRRASRKMKPIALHS